MLELNIPHAAPEQMWGTKESARVYAACKVLQVEPPTWKQNSESVAIFPLESLHEG